jgi:hypothetical protein
MLTTSHTCTTRLMTSSRAQSSALFDGATLDGDHSIFLSWKSKDYDFTAQHTYKQIFLKYSKQIQLWSSHTRMINLAHNTVLHNRYRLDHDE